MAHAQRSGADDDQASGIPESETASPAARKGPLRSRVGRRTIVTVTAAAVVLAGGALVVNRCAAGGNASAGVVDSNTVEYAAGHRPLVPDFTATSLTGTPIKLSSYLGRILVLNFWASWCAPCIAEAPTLEVAYEQYHPQGVDFLGDDLDDTAPSALSFIRSENISYPSINDPGYAVVQQFSQAALVRDPPTTAVIDKTGHVVGLILGGVNIGELAVLLHQAETADS
ncbi:MAG TPA: TlpA disulfide reductase family protein [Trebonia sp.]|jgi:peroxiredoxin|nr:TlpA disulfide reductase family protein [Trebonia sp.]